MSHEHRRKPVDRGALLVEVVADGARLHLVSAAQDEIETKV
jgi:hypothetical protein